MISIIPFKVLAIGGDGFHLVIKLVVNGKMAHVIIDTGASKTVFDKKRIEKFVKHKEFISHDQLSSGLGTNTMTSQFTNVKKIKIGELIIENYDVVLLDLSHVNHSYEQAGLKTIDGVLGSDLLLQYNAIIDYEKKILKFKFPKSKK